MIIKLAKDAREGACSYLENGTEGDRDEKDIRIQLSDLNCYEAISSVNEYLKRTGKWDKYKDNYKHIILSFNNDLLDEETMKAIVNDFVKLYMHCYSNEEYSFYAEAHIPKMQFNERGEKRRPHIHILIHKYSVLLDRRLRFLTYRKRMKELKLIKHYLIKKYNLNYTFTKKAISRTKIDYFDSKSIKSNKQLKQQIIDFIESNLHNFASFNDMIKEIEKTFNVSIKKSKNAETPYISISSPSLKRNVRLKGLLFSEQTFFETKESLLKHRVLKKFEDEYFLSQEEILRQLAERQKLLKEEVERKFAKVRQYVAQKKKAAELELSLKQLNKIMFKINLLNCALNINLEILREFKDVSIINKENSLLILDKNRNVNININTEKDNFIGTAEGENIEQQAKILASIIAEKIRTKEIRKEDLIVQGSAEFKLLVNKFLEEALEKGQEIRQEGKEKKAVSEHVTKAEKKADNIIDF